MSSALPASIADLPHELAATRRALERIPEDQLSWKPHPTSMSAGELGAHCANLLRWQAAILAFPEYDMAGAGTLDPPATRDDILMMFDQLRHQLIEALEKTGEGELAQTWTLRNGDQVVMQTTRLAALRTFGLSHMIHHRGQLMVYLRLLGAPVPAIYGPSGDESPF